MNMENYDLTELLRFINPSELEYQQWVNVGMALKHEGYDASVWDEWSRRDPARYYAGECERKWESFAGSPTPVTAGTIVDLAKKNGWTAERDSFALDWDSEIGRDEGTVVKKGWIEEKEIMPPKNWQPHTELIRYLETLFEAGENVGYVVKAYEKDGKFIPSSKGNFDRTAGELIKELSGCGGDIGRVLGDYDRRAGAWIRFNPLDGSDVKNSNVTDFRYALVESDSTEIEMQNAIIRELELPVAALVYSGGKSLHAIVRIDAADFNEYRKRVEYLYSVCQKNGLKIDQQNKNPSRLSRMPGVERGEKKQFIVDTNIGKSSFNEWKEFIESIDDNLPDTENIADVWENLPELSPPLIDGVLRQGHKMLLAGPSKAGKSFALIELCISIAEGKPWLGFKCASGRVLYVNLELDRASCLHRFKDVYSALGWAPHKLSNIDIWNLRGSAVPMDRLAPKLIRRAVKKNYIAVIIDPIYKVITGDENSADQMANFCNQFDKVCTELSCAVIYCHHHSKGAQGGKRSMDRASGSGVFARDPDALLDLIELEMNGDLKKQTENGFICKALENYLKRKNLLEKVPPDDRCSHITMKEAARELLDNEEYKEAMQAAKAAETRAAAVTAWRIEGTLREFPKFPPLNLWFDYPVHIPDESGILSDVQPEQDAAVNKWRKNLVRKKSPADREKEAKESLETAFSAVEENKKASISELAEYLGVTEKTVRNRLKKHGNFWVDNNECGLKR